LDAGFFNLRYTRSFLLSSLRHNHTHTHTHAWQKDTYKGQGAAQRSVTTASVEQMSRLTHFRPMTMPHATHHMPVPQLAAAATTADEAFSMVSGSNVSRRCQCKENHMTILVAWRPNWARD